MQAQEDTGNPSSVKPSVLGRIPAFPVDWSVCKCWEHNEVIGAGKMVCWGENTSKQACFLADHLVVWEEVGDEVPLLSFPSMKSQCKISRVQLQFWLKVICYWKLSCAKWGLKCRNISEGCAKGPGLGIILSVLLLILRQKKKETYSKSGRDPENRLG